MSNSKSQVASDEKIIAALLQFGTIKEAADNAGTTTAFIYERMKAPEFIELYRGAKNDIIRAAVFNINKQLGAAVDTVAEIMQDKTVNPATRLQAAQTLLNNAGKFATRLNNDEWQQTKTGTVYDI